MPGVQLVSKNESLINEFNELTRNGAAVQVELLRTILQQNANTEYLKDKLKGCTDVDTFKSRLPLITYADIEDDIRSIADGNASPLLCDKPVEMFFLSSGTTKGRSKLIPAYNNFFLSTVRLYHLSGAFRERHFPLKASGKVMDIVYCGKRSFTKGGIASGTGTTHYFLCDAYRLKQTSTSMLNSSPSEVIQCSSVHQATFCHLLFGLLVSTDISVISSTFVYTIVEAFRFLERSWQSLAECIETGTLPDWIADPAIRAVASKQLASIARDGLAELADKLRLECRCGFQGIIPRLWKNSSYVLSIMTGTMVAYAEAMRFYAGSLPLVCGDYGASESWMAINTDPLSSPHNTRFTIVPDLAYFEFLPLERHSEHILSPLNMEHVQIGREYEIIITTSSGLYRYRMGDVVRICGFYHGVPQFTFTCRRDVQLSIHVDKNGETELALAMEQSAVALRGTRVRVAEYSSYADLSRSPGHYVVFVELDGSDDVEASGATLQYYCDCLDRAFVEPGYVLSRIAQTIGPLELCVVEGGTFDKLAQYALDKGATLSQYKTPRCIGAGTWHLLAILKTGVLKSLYSNAIL